MPLPARAGGSGRERVAENLNPIRPLPGRPSYWEIQRGVAARAEDDRAFMYCIASQAAENSGINYPAQHEAEERRVSEEIPSAEGVDIDEDREAEDATGEEIHDALLRLVRENSERARAAIVNKFLRILTLENLPEAVRILKSKGLDSVAAITEQVDREVRESMTERGFRATWVANPRNTKEGVCVFLRDPIGVIQRQLKVASVKGPASPNFFFEPLRFQSRETGEPERSHPMSGDLANRIYNLVREEVMTSENIGVFWDYETSFMCMLQVYTDKSAMSLSTKAHVFYPLHIAVLNLSPR